MRQLDPRPAPLPVNNSVSDHKSLFQIGIIKLPRINIVLRQQRVIAERTGAGPSLNDLIAFFTCYLCLSSM